MKLSSIFLSLFFSLNTAFAANTTTVLGYPSGQATQVCAPTSANSQCLGQGGGGGSSQWTGTAGSPIYYLNNVGIGTSTASKQLTVGSTGQATVDSLGNLITLGNVSIGTNAAGIQELLVWGSLSNSLATEIENKGATQVGSNHPSLFLESSGSNGSGIPGWANAGIVESDTIGGLVLGANGSNPITFQNNRIINMTLDGNGNLGIGTSVPASLLDINEKLNVFSTGNVGIGSANPGQALDVSGTVRATSFVDTGIATGKIVKTDANRQLIAAVSGSDYPPITTGTNLLFGNGAGGFTNITQSATSGSNLSLGFTSSAANTFDLSGNQVIGANYAGVQTAPTNGLAVQGNVGIGTWIGNAGLSVMNGNVGIGTWNPAMALDVNGSVKMTGFNLTGSGTNGQALVTDGSGNGTWQTVSGGSSQWTYTSSGNIGLSTTSTVGIGTTGGVGGLLVMNGNVGMGTWLPGAALDVEGPNSTTGIAANIAKGDILLEGATLSASKSSNSYYALNMPNNIAWYAETNASFASFDLFANTVRNSGNWVYASNGPVWGLNFGHGSNVDYFQVARAPSGTAGNPVTTVPFLYINNQGNVGIGTSTPKGALTVMNGNVGIGTWVPAMALDVKGTIRALSSGTCTTLYQCTGGVDVGIIQTSACSLCPGGTCSAMNGCF